VTVVAFGNLANAPNGKGKTRGILHQRYEMCCRLFSLAIAERDVVSEPAHMFTLHLNNATNTQEDTLHHPPPYISNNTGGIF
jgi:hypothetical protein